MVIFVIGGSGSGKSEYAENRAVALQNSEAARGGTEAIYIATMEPMDSESRKRIERHRNMRAEKNFRTCECYTHLEELNLEQVNQEQANQEQANQEKKNPGKSYITLLECLSNLTANEMFSANGRKNHAASVIKQGILHLIDISRDVIIVGNNVFEDGIQYDEATELYLQQMAELHRFLAEQADEVVEVVCGLPVFWKGGNHEVY